MTIPTIMSRSLIAALAFSSIASAQTTWTVDDNGGADFVDIQGAVDAALDGDVVEVQPGAYPAFVVDGKQIVIHTSTGGVDVAGPVVVRNVPGGGQVEIDGLTVGATYLAMNQPAVLIENNPGTVRLVDCMLFGADAGEDYCGTGDLPDCGPFTQRALRVESSLETVFVRCTFAGGRAADAYYYYGWTDGADGIAVSASDTSFFECTSIGGHGGDAGYDTCSNGGRGGNGARVESNSTFFADRSSFEGAPGGWFSCTGLLFPCCGLPGSPGFDVRLDATSTGTFKESAITNAGQHPLAEILMSPYCFGTFEECPCGNAGIGVAGCENSAGTGGALLRATGWPSVGNDTVTLVVSGLNPNANPTGLFFQGTLRQNNGFGTVLNDGLLCAAGTIVRLKGKTSINGASVYGFNSSDNDAPISVRGQVPLGGGTRTYQFWYRNQPAMFCPPAQFNMSNGVEIVWVP